jgi:hypothetical protein
MTDSLRCLVRLIAAIISTSFLSFAAPIFIAEQRAFVRDSTGMNRELDNNSPVFSSSMDSENYGLFGWRYVNETDAALTGVRLLVFLDADIDRSANTFVNEYGQFISLDLPPGAPEGAVGASSWEIDEPGYVFGDIFQNLQAGILDNRNAVPNGSPDDVSLALSFNVGTLQPGAALRATLLISRTDIDGLMHVDPSSDARFYWNGFVQLTQPSQGGEVPEPSTAIPVFVAVVALWRMSVHRRFSR